MWNSGFHRLWGCLPVRLLVGFSLAALLNVCLCADLVIQIPGNISNGGRGGVGGRGGSTYRLDYTPPHGYPPPNTTFTASDIGDVIQFSKGLPGKNYDFWLYHTNSTVKNLLTWTASIITTPDPPSNLSVFVESGKTAQVTWSAPAQGGYSSYRLKVVPLSEAGGKGMSIQVEANGSPYTLNNLTPGATYQIQLFTVYESKESVAYTSRNFTTKPNTPGKFIVWFRNETTLLVLWQPPYPAGIFTHYKVSIDPPDALESVLYVEKEGEPPGPAQAAFKGLVPGRAYNISVHTVSEDETSAPTTAQYRTVPLRPVNVSFDPLYITSRSFQVEWEPPNGISEFDKYQVSITVRRQAPITRNREEPNVWEFRENLEPGRTYQVVVKTVSGKVTSWPATGNVTLKPLPVQDLSSSIDDRGAIKISWVPDTNSFQERYKISYYEVETFNGDSNSIFVEGPPAYLESLLPGRNYSITVQAVSDKMESNETSIFQATRPSSPIIEDLRPMLEGLNISWKSDVNSRQEKFEVIYRRNDTGEAVTNITKDSLLILKNLYPGAGYDVKVFAISHGLRSEPHDYFQAVYPNPPRNLTIEKVNSNAVLIRWEPPLYSLFSEYAIRYRTEEDGRWVRLPAVRDNEAEVTDMIPGEKYVVQVNTVSYGVDSIEPQEVTQIIHPNPVTNIKPYVDSSNITLEWIRPEGRIDYYTLTWLPLEPLVRKESEADSEEGSLARVSEEVVGGGGSRNISGDAGSSDGSHVKVRAIVGDLMPGVKYSFGIFTSSYSLRSNTTILEARSLPLIQSEVTVVYDHTDTDSLTLRYTPTPSSTSHFDLYRFSLSDPSVSIKEKLANDTDRKVTFSGLIPGRLYNITCWTVSDGVESLPLLRQDRLYPESITMINATRVTDTEITLAWDTPRGEYNTYEVQYLNTEGMLNQNLTLHAPITISGLKPHRNYTFTVVVRSGTESSALRRSSPVSATFATRESVPGKVEKFSPIDIQPSEITFEWSLPSNEQNGVIRKFSITYGLEGSTHTQVRDFKATEFKGEIKSLIPGKTYIFRIQAETRIGYGPEAVWKEKMPIRAPPVPNSQVVPTEVFRTSTTIQIRFRKNYFSEQNGAVIAYAIIVAEDTSKNASGLEMPSWRDVQAYSVWPPYQVMDLYYPFKNSTLEDFTIGSESCNNHVGYCNGPLKPGTTYRVKVRAFTAPDKFTDTAFSFPITTDPDNTAMIYGITIPILAIIIFVIVIILARRRRKAKLRGRGMSQAITRRAAEAHRGGGNDNLSLPDSVIETSRPIKLKDFAEHYRVMSADSDFRFSEEFEELKHVGREQACTAADLPVNRPKNRFTNILPYDHSRFKLQPVDDEDGSDYINANYVPGFNSPREFVVTQGPLHSTRDDFWRACWESNSRAVVMLTRCIEKGREKCDRYWPYDTQPVFYGDIQLTLLNESLYPDWNISEFRMCRGDQSRMIRHFHFTTWPDFGVPDPPQTLVRFVRAFRERVPPDQRPIVVHCSAGVGRSGTFIALDRLLQQVKRGDQVVDIFGMVHAMRRERVWMVQTEQQYICIHQCLLAVLEGKENDIPPAQQLIPREMHDNEAFEGKNSSVDTSIDSALGEKER
ncbi:tyrosine-protein phosphatase 10D isoform X1 [Ischnura elegans]|uniref:tyrosine-protein phosphatase 10D isoform X1 n=1 Tax=Ischnura elegans TaxID=197161 RepID=UPI001ED88CC7|nr:tyrosine-protein phosphatase 10D isoform X1 [Ischnura elegans]